MFLINIGIFCALALGFAYCYDPCFVGCGTEMFLPVSPKDFFPRNFYFNVQEFRNYREMRNTQQTQKGYSF